MAGTSSSGSGTGPISIIQRKIWFREKLNPGTQSLPFVYRLKGPLLISALETCVNAVLRRHECLRTIFCQHDSEVFQTVLPHEHVSITVTDLSGVSETERDHLIRETFHRECTYVPDLERGPLYRLRLLRLRETEHILLLILHAIICDRRSVGLILRDLEHLYNGGSPDSLPPARPYLDYAAHEPRFVMEEHIKFWKGQFLNAPGLPDLPLDRPRPAFRGSSDAVATINILEHTKNRLAFLADTEGVPLSVVLVAVFQIALSHYTGQTDQIFGISTPRRRLAEFDSTVGPFADPFPVRVQPDRDTSFSEWLHKVHQVVETAYANAAPTWTMLLEVLRIPRSLTFPLPFNVLIDTEPVPSAPRLKGIEAEIVEVELHRLASEHADTDMSLLFVEGPDGLGLRLVYDASLFEEKTVQRFLRHYTDILERVLSAPKAPIATLPLLTTHELEHLSKWGRGDTAEFPKLPIHKLFERHADLNPNALAVIHRHRWLTYGEMNRRANQLAHYLQRIGVGAHSVVGICLERSPEWIVAMLATMKAGGAYLPLDPSLLKERLAYMVADAECQVIVSVTGLTADHVRGTAKLVLLDEMAETLAHEPDANEDRALGVDSSVYVMYTSGSTGRPKGAVVHHGGLANLVAWCHRTLEISPSDRGSQVSSMLFDAHALEIYPLLTAGAAVRILDDPAVLVEPANFVEWIRSNRITLCFVVPTIAERLFQINWPSDLALRVLQVGGEQLSMFPPTGLSFRVMNLYGPTECSVVSTATFLEAPSVYSGRPPSIGRPISNVSAYILDAEMRMVPIGVVGELFVGGIAVGKGYLRRPDLNDEAFLEDPLSPGRVTYRTGDLARYRWDGSIEYVGRRDWQVKVRGYRIELGEVESVLAAFPGVREVVVLVRDDMGGERGLVAYVVPLSHSSLTVGDLRAFLEDRLPEYMIPSAFVLLDDLPLTPNGKVDRQALPSPGHYRAVSPNAPRSELEKRVAALWEEVLGVEGIGIDESFFELGGHSLTASRIMAQVRQTFGVPLPMLVIFQAPTVAEFAAELARLLPDDSASAGSS